MVAAAKANGVLLAEAFKFRHHPMHLKAKEIVDSGGIGDVMTLRSTFSPENSIAQMKVIDAALESVATGKVVEL